MSVVCKPYCWPEEGAKPTPPKSHLNAKPLIHLVLLRNLTVLSLFELQVFLLHEAGITTSTVLWGSFDKKNKL